ncbi:hypothetical protein FRC02_008021 [Tulasnella sp. 418]|nr:hypothetical protein FRC02_008021 [Tulasnella sp. 418]
MTDASNVPSTEEQNVVIIAAGGPTPTTPKNEDTASSSPNALPSEPTKAHSRRPRLFHFFSNFGRSSQPNTRPTPTDIMLPPPSPVARRREGDPTFVDLEPEFPPAPPESTPPVNPPRRNRPRGHRTRRVNVEAAGLPQYTREADLEAVPEPPEYIVEDRSDKTIAELLYRNGFICPLLWLAAITIFFIDLEADTANCSDLQDVQMRRERHQRMRAIELKWARKSMFAFAVFVVVVGIILTIILTAVKLPKL